MLSSSGLYRLNSLLSNCVFLQYISLPVTGSTLAFIWTGFGRSVFRLMQKQGVKTFFMPIFFLQEAKKGEYGPLLIVQPAKAGGYKKTTSNEMAFFYC